MSLLSHNLESLLASLALVKVARGQQSDRLERRGKGIEQCNVELRSGVH